MNIKNFSKINNNERTIVCLLNLKIKHLENKIRIWKNIIYKR